MVSRAVLDRRHFLSAAVGLALPARGTGNDAPGLVLMLRHAITDPGVGDPPGYRLDRCASQRRLSAAGLAQALAIGQRVARQYGPPSALLSSAWCRCLDTARGIAESLGAGTPAVRVFEPLNSFFDNVSNEPLQTAALRQRLAGLGRGGGFEIWVTHQVNITALTERVVAMGEGVWLGPGASTFPAATFPS